MRLKHLALGLAVATALPFAAVTAHAEEGIYIPLFTYRTGPFAGSGIPIANGMADYLNMLNERDGGIGGVKLIVEECETGYDTKKGVECYDAVKGKNPAVVNPYSTGITIAANCLSFGREIALSFSSSNARIRTSIRRNNQTPMASMWGKLWHSRCARGGMPGPHCGSAASLENCGVRVPGVRDCAVLRQTPSRMKRAEGTGACA